MWGLSAPPPALPHHDGHSRVPVPQPLTCPPHHPPASLVPSRGSPRSPAGTLLDAPQHPLTQPPAPSSVSGLASVSFLRPRSLLQHFSFDRPHSCQPCFVVADNETASSEHRTHTYHSGRLTAIHYWPRIKTYIQIATQCAKLEPEILPSC